MIHEQIEAGKIPDVYGQQENDDPKQKFKRKLTLLGSDKFEEVKRLMHLKELALKEK